MTLTGTAPGSVWLRSPETGIYSLKVDFLGWYERWLNDSLERVKVGDYKPKDKTYSYLEFGNNNKYGMDPFVRN